MVVSRFQEGNRLVRNGQLEEAIAAYKEAIEQNPSFYWAYQNLGEVLWKLSHLEESVQVYQAAIQCNPTAAWSYYHLGRVLEALGKQQEAQFNYKKAVELHASLKQESQESQIITVKEDLKGSKESGQSIDFQIPSHKSPEEVIKDLREKKRKRKSRKEDSNVVLSEVYVPRVDCILFPVIKRELKDLLN
ncbi:MAG: tetratricopeptide repeat protein [Microcoleaceae cyanobacterium]